MRHTPMQMHRLRAWLADCGEEQAHAHTAHDLAIMAGLATGFETTAKQMERARRDVWPMRVQAGQVDAQERSQTVCKIEGYVTTSEAAAIMGTKCGGKTVDAWKRDKVRIIRVPSPNGNGRASRTFIHRGDIERLAAKRAKERVKAEQVEFAGMTLTVDEAERLFADTPAAPVEPTQAGGLVDLDTLIDGQKSQAAEWNAWRDAAQQNIDRLGQAVTELRLKIDGMDDDFRATCGDVVRAIDNNRRIG